MESNIFYSEAEAVMNYQITEAAYNTVLLHMVCYIELILENNVCQIF